MKKLLFLSVIFYALEANAQNYNIQFTGTGASPTISSIKVENLSTGATLSLNGGDILRLVVTTGINEVGNGQSPEIKIFPNPSEGSSRIQFYPPYPGNAVITLFDITGKQTAQIQSYLENSEQEFQLSGLNNGLYLISVKGKTYHNTGKILSNNNIYGNIVSIERISGSRTVDADQKINDDKGSLTTVDMPYTSNQILKFTGISGNYSTVKTDIPAQDKTITFNFIACADFEQNNYQVVEIGTQVWMAENLKSTKLNDGIAISHVPDSIQWIGLTADGYCWYRNNEAANKNVYGAIYNFYAASNSKLCPVGWHVPTDEQYGALITTLGGSAVAGGKMKESGTIHWASSSNPGTNESGFTGLPGGWRSSANGAYKELKVCGEFWTSTPYSTTGGYSYYLDYYYKGIYREYVNKTVGFSVRCIKD
jgi:uncharacterized protein (TIGR02145 family)